MARKNPVTTTSAGNASDPNVVAYIPMTQPGAANGLIVNGGSAAGTVLKPSVTLINYAQKLEGPSGLGASIFYGGGGISFHRATVDVPSWNPGTNAMVVELWFRSNKSGGFLVSKLNNNTDFQGWALSLGSITGFSGRVDCRIKDTALTQSVINSGSSKNYADGNWHFVRMTYTPGTPGTHTLQVDSDPVVTATPTLTTITNTALPAIGADNAGATSFTGEIALVRLTIGNSTNQIPYNSSFTPLGVVTPGSPSASNLALYLGFQETSGSLTVPVGPTGAGTVFTPVGAPTYGASAPPGLNTSILFNDTGLDYFVSPDGVSAFNVGTNSFVLEFWVQFSDTGPSGTPTIFCKKDGGGTASAGWLVYAQSGSMRIQASDGLGVSVDNGFGNPSNVTVFGDCNWHLVQIVMDRVANKATRWIDGGQCPTQIDFSTVTGTWSNTNQVMIGKRQSDAPLATTGGAFSGRLSTMMLAIGTTTRTMNFPSFT
jgi:Concanavalin A-like lectin/glucanases superfamily